MKQLLTLIFTVLFFIPMKAQESQNGSQARPVTENVWSYFGSLFKDNRKNEPYIIRDMVNSKNERLLICNYRSIDNDGIDSKKIGNSIFLTASVSDAGVTFYLSFNLFRVDMPMKIEKNAPLLIKLKNGDVLTLYSESERKDYIGRVGSISSANVTYSTYNITAQYNISEEEIELLKNGIEKMRFEVSSDMCDFNLKKDNISSFIYTEYGQCKIAIDKKRTFYDGYSNEATANNLKPGSETTVDGIKCLIISFVPTGIVVTTEKELTPIQIKTMIQQLNISQKAVQIYISGNSERAYAGVTDNGYLINYVTNEFTKLTEL